MNLLSKQNDPKTRLAFEQSKKLLEGCSIMVVLRGMSSQTVTSPPTQGSWPIDVMSPCMIGSTSKSSSFVEIDQKQERERPCHSRTISIFATMC